MERIALPVSPAARPGFRAVRLQRRCNPSISTVRNRRRLTVRGSSSAPAESTETPNTKVSVNLDNNSDSKYSLFQVDAGNYSGFLQTVTGALNDLGLSVARAIVDTEDNYVHDQFFCTDNEGRKLTDEEAEKTRAYIEQVIDKAVRNGILTSKNGSDSRPNSVLYNLMDSYIKNDVVSVQQSILNHIEFTVARSRYRFDDSEAYQATSYSVRDRLIESWNDTHDYFRKKEPKRVYYLSMEFLMGRSLRNAVANLSLEDTYKSAVDQLGYKWENLVEEERDAALGNGGLGRLAACFLDSMTTLNLPAWGYGIRYQYGMFRQSLKNGFQHEQPDYWLTFGNPWEIERIHLRYPINFYGHVDVYDERGRQRFRWVAGEQVEAVAYDTPIPGYGTKNTNNLRLWGAKPSSEFNLESFNTGDYVAAILNKQRAETISSVLYPNDRTYQGKELRLKQQHFFVSASLQDIVRRYKESGREFSDFPQHISIQLNDTHPVIAIPELMRILMDHEGLGWTGSWQIVSDVFSFTNHTILPEALERWPVTLMETLLPRHMQIIYDINWRFLQDLRAKFGDDWKKIQRMSIIDESSGQKEIRMAWLACVACHTVNGVAAIHSSLIQSTLFKDFAELFPGKFQNKTNGVTPRRWLAFCNPGLSSLITESLGTDVWKTELDLLVGLREFAEDETFQKKWREIQRQNKDRLADFLERTCGFPLPRNALFDIQVKRIHEYKRQLLNIIYVIHRYNQIKLMSAEAKQEVVPRVIVIGGKAAPGYDAAKRIIKLVSAVGDKVNNDPDVGDLMKVVFVPDYNVSSAEQLVPGAELSQHISTAGTEASGTSNMKFAMNGCLILGTMDGANVEIAEEIGQENMFIFGAKAEEVPKLRANAALRDSDERFTKVLQQISSGQFGWAEYFAPLVSSLDTTKPSRDYYLLQHDFESYCDAQATVDKTYRDVKKWTKMSILSTSGSGKFSSDRTIAQYATEIWKVKPLPVEQ